MRFTKLALLLCILTLAARQLSAQACGNSTLNTANSLISYSPWTIQFTELARLGNHWMPNFGDGDSMTEPLWLTGGANPGYGSAGFQETWYIPRTNIANTAALNRDYSSSYVDHLDDWQAPSAPYTTEFTHGYPWTYQVTGTLPISRYLKGSIFDHRTWLNSQVPAGYAVDAILSTGNGVPRYGYERFGNLLDRCSVLNAAYRDSLSNSLIRIDFNKIWGNAIGKITYGGTRQVVASDIGAMVQSTLFTSTAADPSGSCCIVNPTEAGGVDGTQYGYTQLWAGSPTQSISTTGGATPSLTTVLKPLNFNNYVFQGESDRYSPLLWNGVFNRTTTLGYVAGSTTYQDVIKLQFGAKLDNSNMATYYTAAHNSMNNTFWLEMSAIGTYNTLTYESIDLPTQTTSAVTQPNFGSYVWVCNADLGNACPKYRGLVVASADGSFAIGVTRRETTSTTAPLALKMQWICSGGSQGSLTCGADPQVFFDIYQHHSLSATAYENEDAFMVLGTKATVETRLHQIYCQETGLCTP